VRFSPVGLAGGLARELPVQRTGDEDHAGAALPALLPLVEFTRPQVGRMAACTTLPMATIEVQRHAGILAALPAIARKLGAIAVSC